MLNILHRKGKVKRQLKDRAYVYRPVLSRQKAVTQAVGDMIDRFFGGSADSLVLNLVETRHLTPEKLARIHELREQRGGEDTWKRLADTCLLSYSIRSGRFRWSPRWRRWRAG